MSFNKTDNFNQILKETDEMFRQRYSTSIVGDNFAEVITDNALFESYTGSLLENFDHSVAEGLEGILENTRAEILTESSMTGIQPFASLTMPILVKLWARLAMTEAIPTEPTNTPAFTVPFFKPYVMDHDGNKFYLPEAINSVPENIVELKRLPAEIEAAGGKVQAHDLFEGLEGTRDVDTVDRKFSVVGAYYSDAHNAEEAKFVDLASARIDLDSSNRLYGEIKYATDGNGTVATDTILGHVDLENHTLTLASMSGKLEKVIIRGFVSSEQHTTATQVSFDIDRKDITVGTAEHIEANFPIEFLQDAKAMYDIDGTAEVVEVMSQVSSQKVDLDIIEFLERAYEGTESAYERTFDVYPNSDFAMHPNDWLTGLRKTIDHLAQSMKNDYKNYKSVFVIVGNPLDTDLIPNVEWTFTSTTDTVGGVDVNYSVGATSGSNRYKIISSDLIPQGSLTVFAIPSEDNYKTFVYYPYTFNVVNQSYLNTRNANVPNIMLTRRYTLEEFTPMIGKVHIKNNDGSVFSR